MDGASYMPGVYKIPMVRMTEMSDEAPECKGLKVPHSEMGVWVKAQAVRFSRNGCYETPWQVRQNVSSTQPLFMQSSKKKKLSLGFIEMG